MNLIVDASILVEANRIERSEVRPWITRLLDRDRLYVVQNLTLLEVASGLRRLEQTGEISAQWGETALLRMYEFPGTREVVTQAMIRRVWELRQSVTVYDAAYVALTEKIHAETGGRARLITADGKLARSPQVKALTYLWPRDRHTALP